MNERLDAKFSRWSRADLPGALPVVRAVRSAVGAGERVDRALKKALRARPELGSGERAAAAEISLGIAVHERRLERAGGADADALTEAYIALREGRLVDPPGATLAEWFSVPDFFAEQLEAERGESARLFLEACASPGPVTVRAREDRGALSRELAGEGIGTRETVRSPWGLVLEGRPNLRALEAWRRGAMEVQDEGSQAIVAFAGARPGERVLDRCAGRGGKSLGLWAAMEGEGALYCTDVEAARLEDLRVRARRAGALGWEIGLVDELALPAEGFDLVLLDVPCSETGTLRRSPDLRRSLTRRLVEEAVVLQAAILDEGALHVGPGGRMVYATCSVLEDEDEAQVRAFVGRSGWTLEEELRLWPQIDDTDGFYMARLRRPQVRRPPP